jgi:hypothetical protein
MPSSLATVGVPKQYDGRPFDQTPGVPRLVAVKDGDERIYGCPSILCTGAMPVKTLNEKEKIFVRSMC